MAQSIPARRPMPDSIQFKVPPLQDGHKYHAHLSYCSTERDLAEHIKQQLEAKGFRCLDILPGMPCRTVMSLDNCWKIILVISKEYLSSKRREFETANHLEKSAADRKRLVIPILHDVSPNDVPSYLREVNYLQTKDQAFWRNLVDAIREDAVLSATVPTVDIAEGLAWTYYLGYLALVLPGIQDRARQSSYSNIFNKFIVLMPSSGFCDKDFKEMDSNITAASPPVIKFTVTRSANVQRDYNSTVLCLVDPDTGKEYHVIMEYATPIWSMYEMEMGRIAGLSPRDKDREIVSFRTKLEDMLNNSAECRDKYILLPYDDRTESFESDPHALSKMVAECIQDEQLANGLALLNVSDN